MRLGSGGRENRVGPALPQPNSFTKGKESQREELVGGGGEEAVWRQKHRGTKELSSELSAASQSLHSPQTNQGRKHITRMQECKKKKTFSVRRHGSAIKS